MSDENERSVASDGSANRALRPAVWAILGGNGQYRLPEIVDGAKVCRFYDNDRYVPLYAEHPSQQVVRLPKLLQNHHAITDFGKGYNVAAEHYRELLDAAGVRWEEVDE